MLRDKTRGGGRDGLEWARGGKEGGARGEDGEQGEGKAREEEGGDTHGKDRQMRGA